MRQEVLGDDKEVRVGSEEVDEVQSFDDSDLPSAVLEVILNSFWHFLQRNPIDDCWIIHRVPYAP